MCYEHSNIKKTQRKGIHQLTNQTPHLPQLKFKLDPLKILMESPFCGPYIFQYAFPLDGKTHFLLFVKKLFLKKT